MDHSEKDDIATHIFLPMSQKGADVYDAHGMFLFKAASADIAESLIEALEEALVICMGHNLDPLPHQTENRKGAKYDN